MRKLLLTAGLVAATLAGTANSALAYTNVCEQRKHNDRVTGTVIGGVVGALAGQALGRSTGSTLLGAGIGAIAGNQLSRSKRPCPDGYLRSYDDRYYRYQHDREGFRRTYGDRYDDRYWQANCRWEDRSYNDRYGRYQPYQVQVCR